MVIKKYFYVYIGTLIDTITLAHSSVAYVNDKKCNNDVGRATEEKEDEGTGRKLMRKKEQDVLITLGFKVHSQHRTVA